MDDRVVDIRRGNTVSPDTSLCLQILPGCAVCHAPHPFTRGLTIADRCFACNAPLPSLAPAVIVPAVLTDWRAAFGALLIKIGRGLSRLCKGAS